ncbi:T9SS type A sorting domain-containing protein [candidate division KSB1 bacterium]|nr:T9SS type A sorting domain-containing protein [candidate division KSB1 bacterium]
MKTLLTRLCLLVGIIVLLSGASSSSELFRTVLFDASQLTIDQVGDYDRFTLTGCELSYAVAEPQLPITALQVSLPGGAIIEAVELISVESVALEGQYTVFPVQPPRILSLDQRADISFVEPDSKVYSSTALYPLNPVVFSGQGRMRGTTIANFIIHPVQYIPAEGRVQFNSEIFFKIIYRTESAESPAQIYPDRLFDSFTNRITGNQSAPETAFPPSTKISNTLEPGYYPYVIITQEKYVPNFQPLADWKTKKGVPAKIITTQWLISNYRQGSDNIIRARNFLKDAVNEWGTLWVLIGGDTNIVPVKKCWAMDCQYGEFSENYIPCDLYISDLDCTWNANNNGVYGEIDDAVELYPDVFVGRASADNSTEIDAFVNKVLTYEKQPNLSYTLNILFLADILWTTPYTNTGITADRLRATYVPDHFNATKLYADLGNENRTSVIAAINRGMNIINHDGHAWHTVMGVGDDLLYINDMDHFSNRDKYSILFSLGCWPAAIDYDCIAEHFLTNPKGGGVAFIGNSRYGWGSPGNAGMGYSSRYNEAFLYYLFKENVYNVGAALALAKARYIPYAQAENVYRWCMYQTNLLGDPEMPVWTDMPESLRVVHPATIPSDSTRLTITVTDDDGIPVENARVCLMNSDDIYLIDFTDYGGQAIFELATANPSKNLELTVTAQNYLPYETTIAFQSVSAYFAVEKLLINDQASAYSDSMANPGETITLSVGLKNYGSQGATSVQAILRSNDPRITVIDSTAKFGDLNGAASQMVSDAFAIALDSSFTNGDGVALALEIASAETTWQDLVGISVAEPVTHTISMAVADSVTGNDNGYAEAGETVEAIFRIVNHGFTSARDMNIRVGANDENISISAAGFGQETLVNIKPHSKFDLKVLLSIDPACAEPSFPVITVHAQPANGPGSIDSLLLTVGQTGLDEDVENSANEWRHDGTPDLWHIDSLRSHSGSYSWYSGDIESRTYPPEMNAELISPFFTLAPNSELRFWAWYDVALYSAWGYEGDGLHVEIQQVLGEWQQLDFIGTGGALYPLLMGNDWLPYTYDLSEYAAGTRARLRFRFVSDDDSEAFEGAYIDDVYVGSKAVVPGEPADTTLTTVDDQVAQPVDCALWQNYPNPFNPETTIRYTLSMDNARVTLVIFNILGEKVRTLVKAPQSMGQHSIVWDGSDDENHIVGSGVYFLVLTAENFKQTRKVVFIR